MYILTINMKTEDGLINGTSCTLKHIQYLISEFPDKPSILWVHFYDENIGRLWRLQTNPCTIQILKKSGHQSGQQYAPLNVDKLPYHDNSSHYVQQLQQQFMQARVVLLKKFVSIWTSVHHLVY